MRLLKLKLKSNKANQVTPPPKKEENKNWIKTSEPNFRKLKQLQKTKTKTGAVVDYGTHVTFKITHVTFKIVILVNGNFVVA